MSSWIFDFLTRPLQFEPSFDKNGTLERAWKISYSNGYRSCRDFVRLHPNYTLESRQVGAQNGRNAASRVCHVEDRSARNRIDGRRFFTMFHSAWSLTGSGCECSWWEVSHMCRFSQSTWYGKERRCMRGNPVFMSARRRAEQARPA